MGFRGEFVWSPENEVDWAWRPQLPVIKANSSDSWVSATPYVLQFPPLTWFWCHVTSVPDRIAIQNQSYAIRNTQNLAQKLHLHLMRAAPAACSCFALYFIIPSMTKAPPGKVFANPSIKNIEQNGNQFNLSPRGWPSFRRFPPFSIVSHHFPLFSTG